MYYDIPKLHQTYITISETGFPKFVKDHTNHDKENIPGPEPLDLGGYPFRVIGTAPASGTSVSTVQTELIYFMPREGAIPSYELQLQHTAKILEQITYPQNKRQS